MLPKVLAGCLIGAFVTLLLPREMVARWVGHESGFAGLLIAAFFGFLLPGGPITIYPVAGAFLVMGADAGAVYMPAPQTGSPMTYFYNGKQYLVLAISGAGYSGELVAFKVP